MRISGWSSDVCSSDLVGGRQLEAAQAALSQTVELDPNQFGAYVMQAQLALGRGDVDDAERLARLAARVEPKHPWTRLLEGSVALERGDADRSEEHTSELQSLMRISYAVFCLKKKKKKIKVSTKTNTTMTATQK